MSEAAAEDRGREIWIEKYRPQTLDEVVGHDGITQRLKQYIAQEELPHLLFAGPAGTGKCVTGETPVLTNRGVEQMGAVVGDEDGFEAPSEDLEVATYDESGGFEFVSPSHVFGKEADDLVRVTTRDGNEVTVTPEHRLLRVGKDGLSWTRAEHLESGDRIARPETTPLPDDEGDIDWIDALDGDRIFVHVSESFASEHGISAVEDHVGLKREVFEGIRSGLTDDEIAATVNTPKKTVQAYRREATDLDLNSLSTVCSLSHLRSLDVPRSTLRDHVEAIQYVSPNNRRSEPVKPPWELTAELAGFVGLALAEARIEGSRIKFYNNDTGLLETFTEASRSAFDVDPKTGEQNGVPYRSIDNKTVVHYLRQCFSVFDDSETIGSRLVRAPADSRRAFLRAMFDSEGHMTEKGILELTQKDGDIITLLSYLLSGEGVPTRRKTDRKAATNGSGEKQTYHTLYVSGASALSRFENRVGFSLSTKAERLSMNADRESNPNHDTIPVQSAVDDLCSALYLPREELLTGSLNPDSPGRKNYLEDIERVLDAASERIETAQEVLESVQRLGTDIERIEALPATWVASRGRLKPIETRRELSAETGVRSDRLLEYSDGRRTPERKRTTVLLESSGVVEGTPDTTAVQTNLQEAIEGLGVPYNHIAEGTDLRGTDVINLLENDDHALSTTTRFRTVAERVRETAAAMLSEEVLEALRTLDTLARGDLYFDEVESVDPVEEPQRVYDLTVPETRNYVAGDVPAVMHNTTSAVAIAKEIYGDDWRENFLELNASDQRGIDVVRDRIKSFARASFGGYDHRIIFLDEADALCVPPGTEVITGYPSSPEIKKIEEVAEDGEPMPSVDFETNEIQSDKGRLVDSGVADFFEMELADGRTVEASLTHPFFVVGEDGRLVEKELQELAPGDEIADFAGEIGVSRCEICGDWTAGRFCSMDCKNEGHSREMQRESEFDPAAVSDGGRRPVETVEIRSIEHSHRGKAYNISMEDTPNFMLANGILTHNTNDAQSALRRTMEQFSDNTRFILSCNYSSQIIDPIQSRCAVFRFSPLGDDAVEEQIRVIADAEGIELTDDGVDALVYSADGDMRKAINGLQAAAVMGETVDEEAVYAITSTARPEEIRAMVTKALDGDFMAARADLDSLLTDAGIAGGDIIDQMHRSVWEFDLEERQAVRLMERVGEADYRITAGANEQVQLEALLASLSLDE